MIKIIFFRSIPAKATSGVLGLDGGGQSDEGNSVSGQLFKEKIL
jgi:hypothetical protein